MTNDLTPTNQTNPLTLAELQTIDRNPAAVYLASLAKTGRRTQKQALDTMADWLTGGAVVDCLGLDWSALRYAHAAALMSKAAETLAPASVAKYRAALRSVLKECWRLGLMSAEDYQRAADLPQPTGETLPAGRELTGGELAGLLADCQNDLTPAGVRDAAIIALMYAAGLRRAEVIGLDLASYDPQTGRLVILGKRNKQRTAYLTNGAAAAMADWLSVRGSESGPLFVAINKGGKLQAGRLTPQAVYNLLAKRAAAAGVAEFSPHDLRRTFVSDLLEAGADIATVSKMAGHANIQPTARYDRRPEGAKQKAAGLLHIPYSRRRLV